MSDVPDGLVLKRHRDLVGPRLNPVGLSTLKFINPTMEVYERDAP